MQALGNVLTADESEEITMRYNRLEWQLEAISDLQTIFPDEFAFHAQAPASNVLDDVFTKLAPLLDTPIGRNSRSKKFATTWSICRRFNESILHIILHFYTEHGFVIHGRDIQGMTLCDMLQDVLYFDPSNEIHALCCKQGRVSRMVEFYLSSPFELGYQTLISYMRTKRPLYLSKWLFNSQNELRLPNSEEEAWHAKEQPDSMPDNDKAPDS